VAVPGVVDIEDVAAVAGDHHEMHPTRESYLDHDEPASVELRLNQGLRGKVLDVLVAGLELRHDAGHVEPLPADRALRGGGRLAPEQQIVLDVAAVVDEPAIQLLRVGRVAIGRGYHRDRGQGATGRADGIDRIATERFARPLVRALAEGGDSRSSDSREPPVGPRRKGYQACPQRTAPPPLHGPILKSRLG